MRPFGLLLALGWFGHAANAAVPEPRDYGGQNYCAGLPTPTSVAGHADMLAPDPTAGPSPAFVEMELFRRQANLYATCGYVNGDSCTLYY